MKSYTQGQISNVGWQHGYIYLKYRGIICLSVWPAFTASTVNVKQLSQERRVVGWKKGAGVSAQQNG